MIYKLDMAYHGLSMFISYYIKVMQVVDLTQSTEPQRTELYRDIWWSVETTILDVPKKMLLHFISFAWHVTWLHFLWWSVFVFFLASLIYGEPNSLPPLKSSFLLHFTKTIISNNFADNSQRTPRREFSNFVCIAFGQYCAVVFSRYAIVMFT